MKKTYTPLILAAVMTVGIAAASLAATSPTWQGGPCQTQGANCVLNQKAGMPYGRGLLNPEERTAFRQQMLDAKTQAERDAVRAEHRAVMLERAQAQGVELPMPGMGPGYGMQRNCPGGGPGHGFGPRF